MLIMLGMIMGSLAHAADARTVDVLERTENLSAQTKISAAVVDADDDVCWVAPEWRTKD
jgi:hypothetical protein